MIAGKDLGTIDRHTTSLINRTIKQITLNAKEDEKRTQQLNIPMAWNEF